MFLVRSATWAETQNRQMWGMVRCLLWGEFQPWESSFWIWWDKNDSRMLGVKGFTPSFILTVASQVLEYHLPPAKSACSKHISVSASAPASAPLQPLLPFQALPPLQTRWLSLYIATQTIMAYCQHMCKHVPVQ